MKPEILHQNLKEIFEKLDIGITEQNLRISRIKVKSGFCKVKDKDLFVLDKSLSVHKKNRIMASFLSKKPHEDIYIVPGVREYIEKFT